MSNSTQKFTIRGFSATDEQSDIIQSVLDGEEFVIVNAFAGTGKTSTLEGIVDYLPIHYKILYLSFNDSIARAGEAIFRHKKNVIVKTTHAFSLPYILQRGERIRNKYTASEVSRLLDIKTSDAYSVLRSFEYFCNSANEEVGYSVRFRNKVIDFFEMMDRGDIDKTHSFYLKRFQLNLLNNLPMNVPKFDVVVLDEYQDTNGVTQSIFELLGSPQRVAVGDNYQNIYGFRNSLNRMSQLDGKHLYLTHSFRFGKNIANMASDFLNNFRGETRKIVGKGKKDKATSAIALSRTNSKLIKVAMKMIENGVYFKTIRDPNSIFSLPLNIASLNENGEVLSKNFTFLSWDYEKFENDESSDATCFAEWVIEVGKENDDFEFKLGGELAKQYGLKGLRKALINITKNNNNPKHCSYYLGTAHSSKGLEFDVVKIADDFRDLFMFIAKVVLDTNIKVVDKNYLSAFHTAISKGLVETSIVEEFNLFYVAITRATIKLIFEDEENAPVLKTKKEINKIIHEKYTMLLKK